MESIYGHNKDYMSFSAMRLWQEDKQKYRDKYYPASGRTEFSTVYTEFGKLIATKMETRDFADYPSLANIPYYSVSEHPLVVDIEGIAVKGYLDLFEPSTFSIGEIKTGINKAWDAVKVRKWEQLPFYNLLVKTKYGSVNPLCHLIWLETRFKEKQTSSLSSLLAYDDKQLELTGRMEIFPRRIEKYERDLIKKTIIDTADEIRQDYQNYTTGSKQTHGKTRSSVMDSA